MVYSELNIIIIMLNINELNYSIKGWDLKNWNFKNSVYKTCTLNIKVKISQ